MCAVEQQVENEVSFPDLKEVSGCQWEDADTAAMLVYLQSAALPNEDKLSCRLVLESKQFETVADVLYHENATVPGRWCLVVLKKFCTVLLEEAHQGCFARHLAEKVYDRFRRHYW